MNPMFQEDGNCACVGFKYPRHTLRFKFENWPQPLPPHLPLRLDYQSLSNPRTAGSTGFSQAHTHPPQHRLLSPLFFLLRKHREPSFPLHLVPIPVSCFLESPQLDSFPSGCCRLHTCWWPHTLTNGLSIYKNYMLASTFMPGIFPHLLLNVQIIFFQTQLKFSFSNLIIPSLPKIMTACLCQQFGSSLDFLPHVLGYTLTLVPKPPYKLSHSHT